MAAYYTLHIAGLTRELKICSVSDKLDIAAFILFRMWSLRKRVPQSWPSACRNVITF